jgi:predicted N-acetyltransferase YhbS
VDPDLQNQGIGQQAVTQMLELFPDAERRTVRTPIWAVHNHHFYEKLGFAKVRETEVERSAERAAESLPSA